MLLGIYEHSLDTKNRLTLPSNVRKNFDQFVILSIGIDKCIEIRTPEKFKSYTNTLQKIDHFYVHIHLYISLKHF